MSGKASIHACLLVKTLLKRFMAQDKPPITNEGGSIILGLACKFHLKVLYTKLLS